MGTKEKTVNKVLTPKFRVSFPAVFEPSGFEGQEKKFSVTMLFDKDADLSAMKKAAAQAAKEKWGNNIPKTLKSPFRDGSEKPDLDGYEGMVFVSAKSKTRPGLVDENLQPIIDPSDFFAGCYARASVVAFTYDVNGSKGVAFGLQNIQKLGDGEPFSSRRSAEDDFAPADGETSGADIF